jgi:hypothetical protein
VVAEEYIVFRLPNGFIAWGTGMLGLAGLVRNVSFRVSGVGGVGRRPSFQERLSECIAVL